MVQMVSEPGSCDFIEPVKSDVTVAVFYTSTSSMIYLMMQSIPNRPRQGAVRREDPKHSLRSRGQPWHALYKDCNTALADLGYSLRASQEAIICVVVLP